MATIARGGGRFGRQGASRGFSASGGAGRRGLSPQQFALKMLTVADNVQHVGDNGELQGAIRAASLFETSVSRAIGADRIMSNFKSKKKGGLPSRLNAAITPATGGGYRVSARPAGQWAVVERGTAPHVIGDRGQSTGSRRFNRPLRPRRVKTDDGSKILEAAALQGGDVFSSVDPTDIVAPMRKTGGGDVTRFAMLPVVHSGHAGKFPWRSALPAVKRQVPDVIDRGIVTQFGRLFRGAA